MQYRGFMQFALLLLASGCFIFGLLTTFATLVVCAFAIEILVWSHVLEQNDNNQQEGDIL